MSDFDLKFETDIKYFKSFMKEMGVTASNIEPAFIAFGEYITKETKAQIKAEKSPDGIPWLPLAPSTIRRKKTQLKLRETYKMVSSMFYKAGKTSFEFSIADEKYIHHHYGTRKMPARIIIGVDTEDRRKRLNKEIVGYLKHKRIKKRK